MDEEHMEFLLSSITQFDEMKGKRFAAKKNKDICPRIAALQRCLGFAPGEPINAKNFHRIIPATENIHRILKKRRKSITPLQKSQPGKASTPQNRMGTSFRQSSSHMSGVTSRVCTPNTTNGVNSRFSTPTSIKTPIKKISPHHDIVGAILKRGSSTVLSSHLSTPNMKKSSIVKVSGPQNQITNGTFRLPAAHITTAVEYHLSTPDTKDNSSVKDKVHSSKNSDEDSASSQESGVSVSTVVSEISEYKENEIPDLVF